MNSGLLIIIRLIIKDSFDTRVMPHAKQTKEISPHVLRKHFHPSAG